MVKVTPTVPKKTTIPKNAINAVFAAANVTANDIAAEYAKTYRSWKHKPTFTKTVSVANTGFLIVVATTDEIYNYVDNGTRPHRILPRNFKNLRFRTGYTSKTLPGVLNSWSGGASGPVVFSKGVKHPGTKARGFSKMIARHFAQMWPGRMQAAIDQIAQGL
jgi:hypothetical protein